MKEQIWVELDIFCVCVCVPTFSNPGRLMCLVCHYVTRAMFSSDHLVPQHDVRWIGVRPQTLSLKQRNTGRREI